MKTEMETEMEADAEMETETGIETETETETRTDTGMKTEMQSEIETETEAETETKTGRYMTSLTVRCMRREVDDGSRCGDQDARNAVTARGASGGDTEGRTGTDLWAGMSQAAVVPGEQTAAGAKGGA